ncbi:hypothetical protein [Paenarthrobacter sp.]|uniref:hypothetical protein n=1 Tax=Paenarthrobacter sp. TaxID=1931993 RepID=UPI002812719D|nr:hypothetical protein [Paenarthrobacter sp.]
MLLKSRAILTGAAIMTTLLFAATTPAYAEGPSEAPEGYTIAIQPMGEYLPACDASRDGDQATYNGYLFTCKLSDGQWQWILCNWGCDPGGGGDYRMIALRS